MKLLELEQPLQYAEHAFGTIHDGEIINDPDELIRAYTEVLGPISHMRQVHSDRIVYTNEAGYVEEADAIYTDNPELWLAVKTADCVPVLVSTPHAVAAVHCGWRGLQSEILPKTIKKLMDEYNISAIDVFIHIGPCISQEKYEVEDSYKTIFNEKYFKPSPQKGFVLMDMISIAEDQARELGVPKSHIVDSGGLCTYRDNDLFNSYRRSKHEDNDSYNVQCSLVKRLA